MGRPASLYGPFTTSFEPSYCPRPFAQAFSKSYQWQELSLLLRIAHLVSLAHRLD